MSFIFYIGSASYKALFDIINDVRILKDIGSLSPYIQTSRLEAYHNVVCIFAPKAKHFGYRSMHSR